MHENGYFFFQNNTHETKSSHGEVNLANVKRRNKRRNEAEKKERRVAEKDRERRGPLKGVGSWKSQEVVHRRIF